MSEMQSQKQNPPQAPKEPQVCSTVLYVEDNAANLMLVEILLARRGNIKLLSATDGLKGVELARSHQPAMILMDIKLPGISGNEALKILLDDPATADIPVIALSSCAYASQIEIGLEAGFFRYLTKPFKIDEFTEAVEAALHKAGNRIEASVL